MGYRFLRDGPQLNFMKSSVQTLEREEEEVGLSPSINQFSVLYKQLQREKRGYLKLRGITRNRKGDVERGRMSSSMD